MSRRLFTRLPAGMLLLLVGAALPAAAPALPDPHWHIPAADDSRLEAPPHSGFERLLAARERYAGIVAAGGWPVAPPERTLRPGQRDPAVRELRTLLRASGDFDAQVGADPWFFDGTLRDALLGFQQRHGLPATGEADDETRAALAVPAAARLAQIDVALERWRWLPAELGERYIWVNLPAARLELVEAGEVRLSMTTIIGHPRRPTPSLRSEVRAVEFRPEWTVPRSIAVEDLLPMQQRDPEFLARQRIRALHIRRDGQHPVPLDEVPWERLGPDYFPYVLRQAAGPRNSLGLVRFEMRNPFDIYLHDTPARGFFSLRSRTLSAGCVRLAEPFALADALLGHERADWAPGAAARSTDAPGRQPLREPVPVYLVYFTSWADENGRVHFRPDVYGRDPAVLAALEATATEHPVPSRAAIRDRMPPD